MTHVQGQKNNPLILLLGTILLLAVLLFFVTSFFSSTQQTKFVEQKEKTDVSTKNVQEVKLSWGKFNYEPEVITVKKGIPVHIVGDLDRLKGCFSSLIIKDLGVEEAFTPADNVIEFTPEKEGSFVFGCSMGMGKGTLIVQ